MVDSFRLNRARHLGRTYQDLYPREERIQGEMATHPPSNPSLDFIRVLSFNMSFKRTKVDPQLDNIAEDHCM